MSEIAQYILGVIVIPAAVACLIALPFAVRPLRDQRVASEAGIASALMAAFVVSFANDLGWNAILRQVVALEGDDAPFERWHRVAMVALVLGVGAWGVALARSGAARTRTAVGLAAAAVAAVGIAVLAQFPGASLRSQAELAGLAVLSFVGFAAFARAVMLWASWIVFGVLAFLTGESGFAYLATMCGAMSAGSFLVGAVMWLGAWRPSSAARAGEPAPVADAAPRGVAVPIALAALASVVAVCGRSYDAREIPVFFWYGAALLPFMALFAEIVVRPSVVRRRRLLAFGAVFIGALAMVGVYFAWSARGAAVAPSSDQELLDMYGG